MSKYLYFVCLFESACSSSFAPREGVLREGRNLLCAMLWALSRVFGESLEQVSRTDDRKRPINSWTGVSAEDKLLLSPYYD